MSVLPDFLQGETEEAIRGRMLGRISPEIDKSEGSFIWDALAPAAYEMYRSAGWAQEVLRRGFASTTFGGYLDLRCEEHGISRLGAVKASGEVAFVGEPGTNVPSGQVLATAADPVTGTPSIEYATVAPVMLDANGTATVAIEAVEAGTEGNVSAGKIALMVTPVPGIASVANPEPIGGGLDAEDDAALLARFFARVRSPSVGGNKADYINWALEVPGVGAAIALPLWNGPTTVKVVILGEDKSPASASLVAEVQRHICPVPGLGEGKAPVGAFVTVASAEPVAIDVSATVVPAAGASLVEVRNVFEARLTEYLRNIAFSSDPSVKYVRIGAMLLDVPGVSDFSGLLLNGAADNVAVASDRVAVKGAVTFA
ncbi:baseplate J/gp47 family protein [Cohnella algarum]|uniref:baseplate J/gp47 family protein n=1 Tax=Cohnella algarum TaxID=2044859 RepID=UPI001967DE4B|nr:baseplate J/gp47 family protein [Cohnella algarum]MBN2981965.1 baseplate J/gp47 family protein [Cohnella algarum]